MTRTRVLLGFGVLLVLVIVAALVVVVVDPFSDDGDTASDPGRDPSHPARLAAEEFATAWSGGRLDEVTFAGDGDGNEAGVTAIITGRLSPGTEAPPTPDVEITSVAPGDPTRPDDDDGRATAAATVTWDLGEGRLWSYATSVPLTETDDDTWAVVWSPSVIEPSLVDGEGLVATRVAGERAPILDTTGRSLVAADPAVVVGIRPSRTPDPEATARTVAELTGVDAEELVVRVAGAGPEEFVEVATLARRDYDAIRDDIQPLPGTVFREEEATPSGLPPNYARAVLGTTGPATAEMAASSEGRIVEGEIVGLTGVQVAQDEVLGGQVGVTVRAVAADEAVTPRALKVFPATDGEPVTVTLDLDIQTVADAVLAGTDAPSALVAIRVSTGDVVAVANGPSTQSAFNRAMVGRYPPGSVFKVASTLALFEAGLTPDTEVDCPGTLTVGKVFRNAGDLELGLVPFRTDFARSCNTAFVSQAGTVSAEDLARNAALLGYRELDVGAPLVTPSVPTDGDATEHAAQMIGQGRVETSPFSVAVASASVAGGTSIAPRLVVEADALPPEPGVALPEGIVRPLRDVMRLVVTEGTGTSLADVGGGEVFGKTGTAEFGTETPPQTHAWFTGYQGDLAFAVLVEGGAAGGSVAAPIAAEFLDILAVGG